MRRSIAFWIALAALSPALRAVEARDRAPENSVITFDFALERRYDDNILQMSQNSIDLLNSDPGSDRFAVTTPDDDINVLRSDLRWKAHWIPQRVTRLAFSADAFLFQRNDIKDWQNYRFWVEQELTASRRNLATLQLTTGFVPDFYLQQLTDDDASFAAGQRIRRALTYSQTSTGLRYKQELAGDRIELSLALARIHRDYNDDFNERDNDNDQVMATVVGEPFPHWNALIGLRYLAGHLDARGDLASSPIRDEDISYRHHGLGASVMLPWGPKKARGRVEIDWQPQARSYTTDDKFNLSRHDRVNRREETSVELTQHIWGPLDVLAGAFRLTSDATLPKGVPQDEDVTDFRQTRYSLMLRGRWNWGDRRAS